MGSKEDVIAKLKDDGDFDRLRLNVVRKLKHNVRIYASSPLSILSISSISLSLLRVFRLRFLQIHVCFRYFLVACEVFECG